ncbi:hypothetical protein SAMN02910353_01731 [Ruminococcus sp. YRD2003]|uniref:hypothetical protein n=1 Tax=Ruminococcus sp. YRD2003 TaxID=1452313 RepID=UPI0008CB171C|nr:hypothetical protein SAMN02910353_01731 [Ruminococcus flavefaciens]
MRYLRVLLYLIAADILSLFVGLTLAGSANPLIRVISALCGAGIMLCLMANLALKTAAGDLKDERRSGTKTSLLLPAGMTVTALTVPLASWLVLRIGRFDFYRWHKLVNGWFIQLYNMIQPDASSAALTSGQIWAMLPLAFAPAAVFAVFYVLGYRGVICLEK